MKDFFENLGKIVSETTETVGKKTEVLVEIQKLKSQIRTMERNNSRDYEDIGKIVFDMFQEGNVIDGECQELCEEIEKRENAIEELEKQIADIRGMETCDHCGAHVNKSDSYCANCGADVKKQTEAETPEGADVENQTEAETPEDADVEKQAEAEE